MVTFHTSLNKELVRKLSSVLENTITADLKNLISWKIVLKKFYKFQPTVTLTDQSMNIKCFLYGND